MERVNDSVNPEQKLFEDTIFVDEDEHIKLTWTIESPANIKINLEKLDGPNIDLYTMSELNYEDYKSCAEDGEGSFNFYSDLSDPNTAGTNIEVTVDSGTYVTVIDNTDCGDAKPLIKDPQSHLKAILMIDQESNIQLPRNERN